MRKPIEFTTKYQVDDQGVVWSFQKWRGNGTVRPLNPKRDNRGYLRVSLSMEGKVIRKTVHSLVLTAFSGPRPSPQHQCRHLNGIKTDNRLLNLAWGTAAENGKDKVRLGESSKGEKNGQAKMSDLEVSIIKALIEKGATARYLCGLFDVSRTALQDIEEGKSWQHIESILSTDAAETPRV
jgi:hypothetical protein